MKLAIVIPAYKGRFLRETLESLARQSRKDFVLYVGDDASPDDIKAVTDEFRDRIDLAYRRFDSNLGGRDLVAHWSRCLDMVGDEDFVCIFSDDDILSDDAVASFCDTVEKYPDYDVYHWNLSITDASGKVVRTPPPYPDVLSAREFYRRLYGSQSIDARMPDFIFRTSALKKSGFVSFDLAFRTDNATVMALAKEKGIRAVSSAGSCVLWRDSGINVSSSPNHESQYRRALASITFFNWAGTFFGKAGVPLSRRKQMRIHTNELYPLYPSYPAEEIRRMFMQCDLFRNDPLARLSGLIRLNRKIRQKRVLMTL